MKQTDILTGRIIQRIFSEKSKGSSEINICHGVDSSHSIERLINNLFEFFPDSKISLTKLKFGYEVNIRVVL